MAVLTPTTRPRESNSGPPELPGFSGAVCWMMFSISRPPSPRIARPRALTTPVETVDWKPKGLPMAITNWPDLQAFRVAQFGQRQVAGGQADQGQVGGRVVADQVRVEGVAFRRDGPKPAAAVDHVAVGQGVAVGRQDEARARRRRDPRPAARGSRSPPARPCGPPRSRPGNRRPTDRRRPWPPAPPPRGPPAAAHRPPGLRSSGVLDQKDS